MARAVGRQAAAPQGIDLVVAGPEGILVRRLPEQGSLVVGRSYDADVVVPDSGCWREHVRLHVDAGSVRLEDLERRLSFTSRRPIDWRGPLAWPVGATIRLGSTILYLRPSLPPGWLDDVLAPHEVVMQEPAMRRLYEVAHWAAARGENVLISGEPGVGKNTLARLIHALSPRHTGPMLAINCAGVLDETLDRELFGTDDDDSCHVGLLQQAHGGTLLLGEVCELPRPLQRKLLAYLEHGELVPDRRGPNRRLDVCLLSTTNRNLEHELAREGFRPDLFAQLNGVTLHVPALRDRPADLAPLAALLIQAIAKDYDCPSLPTLCPATLERLREHGWPANVRELRLTLERLSVGL